MRITKDFLAGLMFLVFGAGAGLISTGYTLGTPARMGSGFFPMAIAVLILIMGLAILVRAIVRPETSEPVATFGVRPFFFIAAAIVAFGWLIEDAGLIAALVALIVIARLAGREGSLVELVFMVLLLVAISVGIFVYALNIHLNLWPR